MSESKQSRDADDCVVAVCKCGGAVIMCLTKHMSAETKAELGEAAAEGCDIKHMPAEEVRRMNFGCLCKKSGVTKDLFSEQSA